MESVSPAPRSAAPASPPTYHLTFGSHAETRRWDERIATLDDIRELCASRDLRQEKDGLCFCAATLLGGRRDLKSADAVGILVYDIDGKQSLADVHALLDKANIVAFLYTSHSHTSTRTNIVVDHFEKWAKANKKSLTPTLDLMREYLAAKGKAHLRNLQFQSDWYERVGGEGNVYYVRHDPLDKFRVVIPLATSIRIGKLAANNKAAIDAYKGIYCGVGTGLGLDFDVSCADPCRLFYLPSCPPDRVEHAWAHEYDGTLLDWTQYNRVTPAVSRKTPTTVTTPECMIGDRNLKRWRPNYDAEAAFDIEGFIEQHLSDEICAQRNKGGWTIRCPFEDEHSQPGGAGTFAVNTDGDYPWNIYCSHASCQDAGRKRLDFLAQWIRQGLVSVEDLEALSGHKVPKQESAFDVMKRYLGRSQG